MRSDNILVVDDDPEILSAISGTLESQGYSVVRASSGSQALSILRSEPPALMLLDVVMPETDGFQILEILRNAMWSKWHCLPVVIIVPLQDGSCKRCYAIERGLELGAEDYIEKPVRPEVLLYRVGKALERHS